MLTWLKDVLEKRHSNLCECNVYESLIQSYYA